MRHVEGTIVSLTCALRAAILKYAQAVGHGVTHRHFRVKVLRGMSISHPSHLFTLSQEPNVST